MKKDNYKLFQKIRYFLILNIVKVFAPNLYKTLLKLNSKQIISIRYLKIFTKTLRPAILFIKNKYKNKELIGVELGVQLGLNAKYILKELNMFKLYLIDIWNKYDDNDNLIKDKLQFEYFKRVKKLFKRNKKVIIIRDLSKYAIHYFKDNSLDFVYIDANHKYKYVYQDIELWYNKIKPNGILCGHDILGCKDVLLAVKDYCYKYNKEYIINPPDWIIIKNNE